MFIIYQHTSSSNQIYTNKNWNGTKSVRTWCGNIHSLYLRNLCLKIDFSYLKFLNLVQKCAIKSQRLNPRGTCTPLFDVPPTFSSPVLETSSMFLGYNLANSVMMVKIGKEVVTAPISMNKHAKALPRGVLGVMSPYPTVVRVCTHHHRLAGVL